MNFFFAPFRLLLGIAVVCFSINNLPGEELSLNGSARLLAGMQAVEANSNVSCIENSAQWNEASKRESAKFYWDLEEWEGRKNQLRKGSLKRLEIERFLADNLSESYFNTRNVLYLFGGPDFCYPDLFFPEMETLILIGQQRIGSFPDIILWYELGRLSDLMRHVGSSLAQLPFRSYFVTQAMNEEFQDYSIAAVLVSSMALLNYQVSSCEECYIDQQGMIQSTKYGMSIPGIKITYKKAPFDRDRTVYYFCLDLYDSEICPQFGAFVNKIGVDTAFFKATSFATQDIGQSLMNQLALDHVKYVVQGESGIPYSFFHPQHWEIKLFGVYARPYYSTQAIPPFWGFQKDLRDAYLALILLSGSDSAVKVAKKIWGEDVCMRAIARPLPANVSWQGIIPMHFDYGGQMAEKKYIHFTSALQFAIRKE